VIIGVVRSPVRARRGWRRPRRRWHSGRTRATAWSSSPDEAYVETGATIDDALTADVVFGVNAPSSDQLDRMKDGATLVSLLSRRLGRQPAGEVGVAGGRGPEWSIIGPPRGADRRRDCQRQVSTFGSEVIRARPRGSGRVEAASQLTPALRPGPGEFLQEPARLDEK
jgi:hypothetical protein